VQNVCSSVILGLPYFIYSFSIIQSVVRGLSDIIIPNEWESFICKKEDSLTLPQSTESLKKAQKFLFAVYTPVDSLVLYVLGFESCFYN
jgi:hypothetical protein